MLHAIRRYILQSVKIERSLKIAIIVIGLIGLMDSSYLTYSHYRSQIINCFAPQEKVNSCQMVADSIYSTVLGVPISLIGIFFYLTIITIATLSLKDKYNFLLNLLLPLATLAVLFSLRLTYLQIHVIGYICYYCILSATLSFVLLGISWNIYNKISIPD